MSTFGGVQYVGKNLEVRKSGVAVNRGNGNSGLRDVQQWEKEHRPVISTLGRAFDEYLSLLRSKGTPYRWAKEMLLDYDTTADAQEVALAIDAIGHGYDGTSLVFKVKDTAWLPVDDLMRCVLKCHLWRRDAKNRKAREAAGKKLIEQFTRNRFDNTFDSRYLRAGLYDSLLKVQYCAASLKKLKDLVRGNAPEQRLIAIRVLRSGGFISDPVFYDDLLEDENRAVRREAMLALLLMPGDKGLNELRRHAGSVGSLLDDKQRKKLKNYLS